MSSILLLSVLAAAPAALSTPVSPSDRESERREANMVIAQAPVPGGETRHATARSEGSTRTALAESALAPAALLPVMGVPFACGARFPVSQGHATGSHRSYDTHAWDFRMPEGTPITAARAGVVRMARGDSDRGGCDPKFAREANYVVIAHEEGLETQYLHFSSVVVKPGDRVAQGELIGYSGNTGWSCGPHLHFKVARRENDGWNNPSLPALLEGHGDPVRGTLVQAPACAPLDQPRYAGTEREQAPVADPLIGAGLPDGPVERPATALGGTSDGEAMGASQGAGRDASSPTTRKASGERSTRRTGRR